MELYQKFLIRIPLLFVVGILAYVFLFSTNPVQVFAGYGDAPSCTGGCSRCPCSDKNPDPGGIILGDVPAGGLTNSNPPGDYWDEDCDCVVGWGPKSDGEGEGGDDDDGGIPGTQPPPTCTIDLVPASSTISIGSNTPLVASFSESTGTVDEVHFSSDNGNTTVSPAADSDSTYGTTATGAALGTSTITAVVHMTRPDHSHVTTCSDTATVTVTNPPGWWQTKDADVWSRGDLTSNIPVTCTGACVNKFSLDGAGGFPGVIVYNGSSNFGSGSVSSKNWQANSGYTGTAYNYAWFENKIPAGVTVSPITDSTISGGTLVSSAASTGYTYFKRTGDLTITSEANLNNKKAILFVTGNLTIQGRININDGTGFFMTVVGGNINIDPGVSHPNQPALEGAYFTDGNFSTGTGGASSDSQLYIRGSIVANGSINLQRDLGDDNQTTPAEYIEFAPDLIFTFPSALGSQNFIWREIAP